MKYLLCIALLFIMCGTATGASTQTINAPYLNKAPVIDGVISGSEWDQASGAPVALDFKTGQVAAVTSEFRIGRVEDTLYFLFDASRIGRLPLAQKRDRDGAMWDDDGVELFLTSGQTKIHTIINAYGDIYDAAGQIGPLSSNLMDTKWNAEWTVRAQTVQPGKLVSGGFIIEGALSLSNLQIALPKDSDQWGLQIAFNLRYHNPMAVWHVPAADAFQTDFGKLTWGGKTARISRIALAKAGAGLAFTGEFTEPVRVTFNAESESVTGNIQKVFEMPADHKYAVSAIGPLFSYEMSGSVPNGVELDSTFISPNGDGLNDKLSASFFTIPGDAFSVDITDKSGNSMGYIIRNKMANSDKSVIEWNGKVGNKRLADGDYTIRLLGGTSGSVTGTARVKLDSSVKVSKVKYKVKSSFPIGTWFEGHPGMAKSPWDPAGAEAFYDKHLGIMEANGINFVAVPNLPENLQDPLLRTAEKHNIEIAIFVASLYDLVGSKERVTEADVLAACKKEFARLGKYPALTRYQVKDEPFPTEIPNLLTVQRILAMVDPTRPAFSCFQQPTALQRYVESTVLTETVFDHYPIYGKTPAKNIGDFMTAYPYWISNCGNNNHWAVLQAFYRMDDWREPSADELRAMTYVALAYGAKGLVFFLYNDMPGILNGMVSADGTTQPMFDKTTVLTKELVKLKPLLMSLKQTNKAESDYKDYVIGRFATPKKQNVIIVASGRVDGSQIVQVTGAAGEWKDAITGQSFSSSGSVLIVPLGPGVGRVLVRN